MPVLRQALSFPYRLQPPLSGDPSWRNVLLQMSPGLMHRSRVCHHRVHGALRAWGDGSGYQMGNGRTGVEPSLARLCRPPAGDRPEREEQL